MAGEMAWHLAMAFLSQNLINCILGIFRCQFIVVTHTIKLEVLFLIAVALLVLAFQRMQQL